MLNLEINPIISSNTYFGTILIPELNPESIPIEVTRTLEMSPDGPTIKWNITPCLRKAAGVDYRGKEKRIIYEAVMNEIERQKLIL